MCLWKRWRYSDLMDDTWIAFIDPTAPCNPILLAYVVLHISIWKSSFSHRMIDERVVVGIKKGRSIFTLQLWKNVWNVAKETFIWDTIQNLLSIFLQALPRVRAAHLTKTATIRTMSTVHNRPFCTIIFICRNDDSLTILRSTGNTVHTRMWWCGSYFNSIRRKRFGHG